MIKATGGLTRELPDTGSAWLSAITAHFATAQHLFEKIDRLLLVRPDGVYIDRYAQTAGVPTVTVAEEIKAATRMAQHETRRTHVRWFDGPVPIMVFGDPNYPQKAWLRVDVDSPFAGERVGFLVRRSDDGELYDRLKNSFERLWQISEDAPKLP